MNSVTFFRNIFKQDRPKELILILSCLSDMNASQTGTVSRSALIEALEDIHPTNISRGCKVLESLGLIVSKKEGSKIFYLTSLPVNQELSALL